MGIRGGPKDTLVSLQRAQVKREAVHKFNERLTARAVVEEHARIEHWSQEDIDLVLGALGLDET